MPRPRKMHNPDASTIGGRIERCMSNLGMTDKRLATAVGVSPDTVKAWIRNEQIPDYDMLELLSVRFDIPSGDNWLETGKHPVNIA